MIGVVYQPGIIRHLKMRERSTDSWNVAGVGVGVYLGSYLFPQNVTLGEWLIKALSCRAFANKPFYVD